MNKNVPEIVGYIPILQTILATVVSMVVLNVAIILLVKFVTLAYSYLTEIVYKLVKTVNLPITKLENVKTVLLLVLLVMKVLTTV